VKKEKNILQRSTDILLLVDIFNIETYFVKSYKQYPKTWHLTLCIPLKGISFHWEW